MGDATAAGAVSGPQPRSDGEVVEIARCPEHGLQGQRDDTYYASTLACTSCGMPLTDPSCSPPPPGYDGPGGHTFGGGVASQEGGE